MLVASVKYAAEAATTSAYVDVTKVWIDCINKSLSVTVECKFTQVEFEEAR